MKGSLLKIFVKDIITMIKSLTDKLTQEGFNDLLTDLGLNFPASDYPGFDNLISKINNLDDIENLPTAYDDFLSLLSDINEIIIDIKNLSAAMRNVVPDFDTEFGSKVFNYLLINYLEQYRPAILAILKSIEIIQINYILSAENIPAYRDIRVNWSNFQRLFSSPGILGEIYQWDTNLPFNAEKFLNLLEEIIVAVDIPSGQFNIPTQLAKELYNTENDEDYIHQKVLRIPFVELPNSEIGYAEIALLILGIPIKNSPDKSLKGFAIVPYSVGETNKEFQITNSLHLDLNGAFNGLLPISIFPRQIDIDSEVNATFSIQLSHEISEGKIVLFGNPDSSRFEYQNMLTGLQISYTNNRPDLRLNFSLTDASIILEKKEGDGFLQKILPSNPISLNFDIAFGWSSVEGFYIKGGGGFEYTFPINQHLGPFFINSVDLGLDANNDHIKLISAITGSANIGPVTAVIGKVGLSAEVEFGKPGIFGNADFALGFKPPTSIGLAIDAEGLRGGGFLSIEKSNYAGILNVAYQDTFDLTVIGLITTELPNGQSGFSMVLSILAKFQPVQLGFGFALKGVGGLIGIHRSLQIAALQKAYRERALDAILFPENPIQDAIKIINAIRAIFPPEENYHSFGLMALITWGGAAELIQGKLGIMIQIGNPVRIALIGQLHALLPNKEKPIVTINMDLLGCIDCGEETISFDASIYDSKLLSFPISGDMSLRANYGNKPDFALAVGGFFPGYHPTLPFPNMKRMAIQLGGDNAEINLTSYFAITANSIQTGASINLKADWGSIRIKGGAGFDALVIFRPFSFETRFYAWVKVRWKSFNLGGIDIHVTLTGPNRYHIWGYAEIDFRLVTVEVEFDAKFGKKKEEHLPEVRTFDVLLEQVNDFHNFTAQLPAWASSQVTYKDTVEKNSTEKSYLAPGAYIIFSQKAIPIELQLERYAGGIPPEDERYLSLSLPNEVTAEDVKAPFSPAQYRNWSDKEKISAPPFENYTCGKKVAANIRVPQRGRYINPTYEIKIREFGEAPKICKPKMMGHISNQKILNSINLLGAKQYFNPDRVMRLHHHRNWINFLEPKFTLTGHVAANDGFVRINPTNGQAVEDMTFLHAHDLQRKLGGETVIRSSAFAQANLQAR